MMNFSKDATSPPSIHPAPCMIKLAWPMTAPQVDISDS
jgi:hypothetical protein